MVDVDTVIVTRRIVVVGHLVQVYGVFGDIVDKQFVLLQLF